jgi:HD-GYP domain-containing protein (c-di-GMP phosphodiesterase class II)
MRQQHSGLRQAEIIMALSLATDLGTGRPMEWALSTAVLGVRFGEMLGLNDQQLREVYYLALLRFIGCTTDWETVIELFGDQGIEAGRAMDFINKGNPAEVLGWAMRYMGTHRPFPQRLGVVFSARAGLRRQSFSHCEVAERLAAELGLEEPIRMALWHMYEGWNGKGEPRQTKGEAISLPMRIVHLVHDVETYRRAYGHEAVLVMARQRAGSALDPGLVETFCQSAQQLLAGLDDTDWESALLAEPGDPHHFSDSEIDRALMAMADFTDMMSPHYACHSRNVASLAAAAARHYRLPESDVKTVERAGWLHDIGKVSVPPSIICKEGSLTKAEWERMRMHPYYTERVLARPEVFAQWGAIAATHHERLDGSGYHRGLRTLSPAAHLLAAANRYQALIEARPHRDALTPEAAADELRRDARAGRLDGDAVKAVMAVAGHHTTPVKREQVAGLTERELEVLRLIVRGLSNRQMAHHLSLSEKTIGNHIMHIYEKIEVSTRAAATLFAMQHGLVREVN